jgi:hypothetical protein
VRQPTALSLTGCAHGPFTGKFCHDTAKDTKEATQCDSSCAHAGYDEFVFLDRC